MIQADQKLTSAHQAFRAAMETLRKKRMAWLHKVVGRIEQEKIAAIRNSLKT